jgi:hypothetical protein
MTLPFVDYSNTQWSKMIIVTGIPGSRADFLAGCLSQSHLSKFQHMRWSMSPGYGISTIASTLNWHVLDNTSTDDITRKVNAAVDKCWRPDAKWAICKSHQFSLSMQNKIPVEHVDKFIFVDLTIDTLDVALQVQWESFVKNILWNYVNGSMTGRDRLSNYYQIPDGLDDITALRAGLDYMFEKNTVAGTLDNFNQKSAIDSNLTVIPVDYSKIMQPDGIVDLAGNLGITDVNIELWNEYLPRARSPDRLFVLDHWWEKPNYLLSGK